MGIHFGLKSLLFTIFLQLAQVCWSINTLGIINDMTDDFIPPCFPNLLCWLCSFFRLIFWQIRRLCHTIIRRKLKRRALSSEECCVLWLIPSKGNTEKEQFPLGDLHVAKIGILVGLSCRGGSAIHPREMMGNLLRGEVWHYRTVAGRAQGERLHKKGRGGLGDDGRGWGPPGPRGGTCAGSNAPATESPIQRCSRRSCW